MRDEEQRSSTGLSRRALISRRRSAETEGRSLNFKAEAASSVIHAGMERRRSGSFTT
jgi:hypothetical protein